MRLLLVDNTEPADAAYNTALIRSLSRQGKVEVVGHKSAPRCDFTGYDGIILSGVPKTYSYEIIDSRLVYLGWLDDVAIPVLGICLGHQNIGRFFGAPIIKDLEAEEGVQELHILQEDPLFEKLPPTPHIITSHRGSVSLPDGFIQLASTATCVNQVMKHPTKDIYGVQFHPELSPAGIQLLGNFVNLARLRTTSRIAVA